jgi:hypothetical protein
LYFTRSPPEKQGFADTVSLIQEIREKMPDYPQPVHGARTPNPASGEWGLVPTSHEKTSASCHCERSEAKQSPGRYGDCFAACGGSQCNGRKFSTRNKKIFYRKNTAFVENSGGWLLSFSNFLKERYTT